MPKGVLFVMSAPTNPDSEDAYNDWYDNEHLDDVLELAGYQAARRYRAVPNPGPDDTSGGIDFSYMALYEVEADDLKAAHANLLEAAGKGAFPLPDSFRQDPGPVVQMFEQITERSK